MFVRSLSPLTHEIRPPLPPPGGNKQRRVESQVKVKPRSRDNWRSEKMRHYFTLGPVEEKNRNAFGFNLVPTCALDFFLRYFTRQFFAAAAAAAHNKSSQLRVEMGMKE